MPPPPRPDPPLVPPCHPEVSLPHVRKNFPLPSPNTCASWGHTYLWQQPGLWIQHQWGSPDRPTGAAYTGSVANMPYGIFATLSAGTGTTALAEAQSILIERSFPEVKGPMCIAQRSSVYMLNRTKKKMRFRAQS